MSILVRCDLNRFTVCELGSGADSRILWSRGFWNLSDAQEYADARGRCWVENVNRPAIKREVTVL
jgi:hypothetical protein